MDPSKFPTDNLYKFMALAGLVLVIAAPYLASQNMERVYGRLSEAQAESLRIDELYRELHEDSERMANASNAQWAEAQAIDARLGDSWNKLYELDQAGKLTDEIRERARKEFDADRAALRDRKNFVPEALQLQQRVREISLKGIDLRAKLTVVDRLSKQAGVYNYIAWSLLLVGFAVAYLGFHLWYHRLQKHLDRAVAAAAKI